MKRFLVFAFALLVYKSAQAQPIVHPKQNVDVKLEDLINQQKSFVAEHGLVTDEYEAEEGNGEGKNYHFDRWLWYWKQHTDENGNIVSPMKTWQEWEAFKAQQKQSGAVAKTTNSNANWIFEGPDSSGANGSGVGRINVVAFDPTDSNTYWVGSPGGGAWKTTDNGAHWTCMTDHNPILSVTDIVINPLNHNTVYLCTGDGDGRDYYSIGVLKSVDGGQTWNTTGLTWAANNLALINKMVINPLDTNTLFVAASDGIHRSFNGGATWANVYSTTYAMKQILYHPTDTTVLYATSFDINGITSAQIFKSTNGGANWHTVSSFTNAYRIALAVTPADVKVVKAIVASSGGSVSMNALLGIYSSSDTGNTFTQLFAGACSGSGKNLLANSPSGTGCTNSQGWYDLCIAVSPTNANNVYVGGVNTWSSTNGGTSWTILNQWTQNLPGVKVIHADKHFLAFNPFAYNKLFEGNDGGVYWALNPASNGIWNNVTNGLGITEFYRMALSNIASYEIAGAQDNGTKYVQFKKYKDAYGGDGMQCQMDWADSTTFYASTEYGGLSRITLGGGSSNISVSGQTGAWVTPFIIEPMCHNCLLCGYQKVYKSTNKGSTWTAISGTLPTLGRVVVAPTDSNTIYATEDGGRYIHITHDGGTTWSTVMAIYASNNVSDILVDPLDPNHIWITYSGYNTNCVVDYNPNRVPVWTALKFNLPNVPVNCIQIDTSNSNLYIGTDLGVFYKVYDTTVHSWTAYNTGMPVVRVSDLQINYTTNEIWAATYGRSLWKSPKQVNDVGISVVPFSYESLMVYPNPSHGDFTIDIKGVHTNTVQVNLYDLSGKLVWNNSQDINGSKLTVGTAGLTSGTYIVEVADDEKIIGRNKVVIYK